jgi:hypothetical protein
MPAFTTRPALSLKPCVDTHRAHPAVAHTLRLEYSWHTPSTVVISAHGYIDASNANDLIVFVRHASGPYGGLVLDLRGVTFFGTEGLSSLRLINQAHPPVPLLAVVPGPAVVRLLKLGAPGPTMPIAEDLEAALVCVQSSRPLLQVVAGARL